MENTNIPLGPVDDSVTKDILANSGPELSNPRFNSMVMNKIMRKQKQRSVINYILLCSLFIIVVSALMILLAQSGHSGGPVLPEGFDSFGNSAMVNVTMARSWIMGNLFLILPVVVLLFLKNLIDARLKNF